MNHKQKFLYTLLGAGIMAVGITIGQFITPNIDAQSNGVFDKVICRELEVVDAKGNKAIVLAGGDGERYSTNHLIIYYPQSKEGIELMCNQAGTSIIRGLNRGDGVIAFELVHYPDSVGRNTLSIWNKELGGTVNYAAFEIECNKKENRVFVRDRRFERGKSYRTRENTKPGVAIGLHSHLWGNDVFVVNPQTGTMRTLEDR